MARSGDSLGRILLTIVAASMITIWLPLVRGAMDGETYSWNGHYFGFMLGGSGIAGDYWKLVVVAAVAVTGLRLGWRGARQPGAWIVLGWILAWTVAAVHMSVTDPAAFRFRGDTLGVDVSLAVVGPVLFGTLTVMAIIWTSRSLRAGRARLVPPWTAANTRLLAAALALLPVQLVLLRAGSPHGLTDQIGVVLTMLQWAVLNVAFAWGGRAR
jgi:hypothetical protein